VRRLGRERLFSPETLEQLRSYAFPGNVRELRYAIEQAVILSEGRTLTPEDFPFLRLRAGSPEIGARPPIAPREIGPDRLREALEQCGGNRVRAARALGISRATLYRLLDRDRAQKGETG
jgi:two-component system response regulator AtoC